MGIEILLRIYVSFEKRISNKCKSFKIISSGPDKKKWGCVTLVIQFIQSDSRGKVNILGGDSIGHCETKSFYGHVSNSEWLPR
jgi:hypothetical protein